MSARSRIRPPRRRSPALAAVFAVSTLVLAACGDSGGEGEAAGGGNAAGETGCQTGDYPEQTVNFVIPYAAGGGTDTSVRPFAQAFEEEIDESVVVVNTEGGGGVVGIADVASSQPDGYTVGVPIDSILTVQPQLNSDVSFDHESFDNIKFADIPQLVVAGADQPFDNLEEFLEAAKDSPGELRYGVPGLATSNDLQARALELAADVDLRVVPFAGGGADSLAALTRGDVEVSVIVYPTVRGLVESGDLKVLGVLQEEPLAALPDVQTLSDLGLESPNFYPTSVFLSVPEETPDEVVEALSCTAEQTLSNPELVETWEEQGINAVHADPEESDEILVQINESFAELSAEFPDLKP